MDIKLHRGNQIHIDLQADRVLRRIQLRLAESQRLSSFLRLIRSTVESLEAIQPQVTIYPDGDFDFGIEIKEA